MLSVGGSRTASVCVPVSASRQAETSTWFTPLDGATDVAEPMPSMPVSTPTASKSFT